VFRAVFDTSVIVAALRSRRGASNRLVELVALERLRPLVTTALFLEYEEVLQRPEHRLVTGMSAEDVEGFLAAFASAAEAVEVNFRWRPQLKDSRDEFVLEAAVNGNAGALVTHNVRDFRSAAQLFNLRVLLPRELLKELEHE
jgi:putative PIN family toxin of toxin-antitoxin system